jgi:hypothetical protein
MSAVMDNTVTDNVRGNLARTKHVTRITCAKCYRQIGMNETAYRPMAGGWEGTYCCDRVLTLKPGGAA